MTTERTGLSVATMQNLTNSQVFFAMVALVKAQRAAQHDGSPTK